MSDSTDAKVSELNVEEAGGCPVAHGRRSHPSEGGSNRDWWPNQLNLRILRKHPVQANPMGADFDYGKEFLTVDLDELARDVDAVLTESKDWWLMDFGHYGPFMIRMAWHSAGTYRTHDGAVAPAPACSASLRSTAGRTTATWTRPAVCCGRSRRSGAAGSPGPTS